MGVNNQLTEAEADWTLESPHSTMSQTSRAFLFWLPWALYALPTPRLNSKVGVLQQENDNYLS
jgi:hypothetical protein